MFDKLGTVLFGIFFAFSSITHGQVVDGLVTLSLTPSNPRAGETIRLSLTSSVVNLSTTKITWSTDNVVRNEGIGATTFSFGAKTDGGATAVRAVLEDASGVITTITRTIVPGGVDLIVEPSSYVPPLYKGKPIFTTQGTARLVALPDIVIDGRKIPSSELVFRWRKDGLVAGSLSGAGKNTFIVQGGVPIRDVTVDVEVLDSKGVVLATAGKILSSETKPKILFYENSLIHGILYNRAITSSYFLGNREEVRITAKPYFFNLSGQGGSDSRYAWTVNGNPVTPSEKTYEILLRQTTQNLRGTASVSVTLNNVSRIFQYTTNRFDVEFGQ